LQGLKDLGVNQTDLEEICRKTDIKNNPVKLAVEDLLEILNGRL
jgi:alcohol dehydrogenase class IV